MINKVILVGNLGRDPEIRHFDNGGAVARFSVATNENYRDRNGDWQTRTEWHNVNVWGPSAERASQTLSKGKLVYIEGKLTSRKWQDKEGVERTSVEVRAQVFRLLERRESSNSGSFNDSMPSAADMPPEMVKTNTNSDASGTGEAVDDDLPF